MKKTVIGISIGFLIVFSFGIFEMLYLESITEELISYAEKVESFTDNDKKAQEITGFRKLWNKNQKFLSVLVDHQDIHKIESALVEIESILKNNLTSSHISTNFALLKLYIEDMADERKFTLRNVL